MKMKQPGDEVGRVTPCAPLLGVSAHGAHGATRPPLPRRWMFAAVLFCFISALLMAQTIPVTKASGTRFRYFFEPPNETKLKARVTAQSAVPFGKSAIQATQLHIETFRESGELEAVIDAPDCIYDHVARTAWSAGDVKARTGDGKMTLEGTGFLLTLTNISLTISNNVRTVFGDRITFPKKI